jgi:peptidoglycan/LPS O-acetylase OafA/YrhL
LVVPEEVLIDWAAAVGASMFIMLTLASRPLDALLSKRVFVWLGRTSYSLYLAHLVVLLAVVHLLTAWVPLGVAVVPALVIAFVVAGLTHRLVEVPSIQLGRWLAVRVKGTTEPRASNARPVPASVAAGQS